MHCSIFSDQYYNTVTFSHSFPHKEHSVLPSLPLCLPNSSFRPCVPDLNLNKSQLSASHIPCKYFLNSTLLPKRLYIPNLTLVLSPSSNFLLSLSLIHSSTLAINEADELSPLYPDGSAMCLSPISPLITSLQVLEENPRIRLAPSNIMDSKEPA